MISNTQITTPPSLPLGIAVGLIWIVVVWLLLMVWLLLQVWIVLDLKPLVRTVNFLVGMES